MSHPPITVAIQGEVGSFSHAAAVLLHGSSIRLVPCPEFDEIFHAVASGEAERGIVPIENSLAGPVHENYDLLGVHALHVVAEVQVRIRHCLIARPDTVLADVRRVASHPMALAQCRRFFAAHPTLEAVPSYDTAGSVRDLMARHLPAEAVIGPARAAELYGAAVLERDLEDHADNFTRFLAVAREEAPAPERGTAAKISVVFTLPQGPGTLHRALGAIATRGLDLTLIESRPVAGRPWEYVFYVDVLGSANGPVSEALASLKGCARDFRVLGVYSPADGGTSRAP